MQMHEYKLGSFLVSVFTVHGHVHAKAPGPEYWVDIVDAPRQVSVAVSSGAGLESDIIYPIWTRLADLEKWIHDDFGNLVRPGR